MRLLCWFWHSKLAELAMQERCLESHAALQRHVAHCPDCRAVWNDMTLLHSELTRAIPALPAMSEGFDAALWARLSEEKSRTQPLLLRRKKQAWALSAVCLTLGALWLRTPFVKQTPTSFSENQTPRQMARRTGTHIAELPANKPLITPRPKAQPLRSQPPQKRLKRTDEILQLHRGELQKRRKVLYRLAMSSPAPTRRPLGSASPLAQGGTPSAPNATTWAQLGSYYERNGSYSQAAHAYRRAYAQKQDPALAFAAGRAAESAGDSIGALELFIQVMQPQTPQNAEEIQQNPSGDEHETHGWNRTRGRILCGDFGSLGADA